MSTSHHDGAYEPSSSLPSRNTSPGAGRPHTTQRSPCPLCGRLVQRASLLRHQRSKRCDPSAPQNVGFKFRCGWDGCGFETNYRHHLRGHERRWHTAERHRCLSCDFQTPWPQCLTKHLGSCPGPGEFCNKRKQGRRARMKGTTRKIKEEENASPPPLDDQTRSSKNDTIPSDSLAAIQHQDAAIGDLLTEAVFFDQLYHFSQPYSGTEAGGGGFQYDPALDQMLSELGSTAGPLTLQPQAFTAESILDTRATPSISGTPEPSFDPFYLFPEMMLQTTPPRETVAPSWEWPGWISGVGKELWGSTGPIHSTSAFGFPLLHSPEASWPS
ncbi:hypothetical protein OF83DRAFT_127723 [Amylostereum chailletii]|nr:hypothetical protein OF83DRAFT_127723 [Amylostereum chailletii]